MVLRPEMRAVDGRRGFQDLREPSRQACVAEFSLPAGEFIAVLEIPELIFQLNELGRKEQVLGGVIRNVVGDGIVPDVPFRGRESGFRLRRDVQSWCGGMGALGRLRGGGLRSGFVIDRGMNIDPEPTVKVAARKRPAGESS